MTDRDYMEVLMQRARAKVEFMRKQLVPPLSEDFKFSPHVAQDRLKIVAKAGKELQAYSDAAI